MTVTKIYIIINVKYIHSISFFLCFYKNTTNFANSHLYKFSNTYDPINDITHLWYCGSKVPKISGKLGIPMYPVLYYRTSEASSQFHVSIQILAELIKN